jgi:hypothetical protein
MRKKRGLRNFIVALLRRRPRNGAELMDDMEILTHGWWRPSPGSMYPLLEEMVGEGTLRKRDDGRYELVNPRDAMHWDWPRMSEPRTPAEVAAELRGLAAYLEDLKRTEPSSTASIRSELDEVVERLQRLRG